MYIPLQVKTNYSLLSSLVTIKNLIKKCVEYNINAVAITDTNMSYVMEFYNECVKNNIKPIIGLEINIKDKNDNLKTILLYAKNKKGYQNLIKLSTINTERNIIGKDLVTYKDNLICIIPYLSSGIYPSLKKVYKDIFIGYKDKLERNNLNNVPNTIFINNVLYLEKEESNYLNYLYMIRDGKKENESEILKFYNNHLMTLDEVNNFTRDFKNMQKIYDMCNIEFKKSNKAFLPQYREENDEYKYLTNLCILGLKKRLKNTLNDKYINRLKYELEVVNQMGFCNYFLIVYDYVRFAKSNDILVGPGRGSAAGSLIAYSLGITDIDPIKYDLLFERFLNPERVTMPDIDMDFQFDRRDEVVNYCIEKYGLKNVANIITYGTLGAKQVIRDVARVLDLPNKLVDRVVKFIDKETLVEIYEKNAEFKKLMNSSNDLKKLYDIASHLEGLKRHSSIHAAGIIMSSYELDNLIPLVKNTTDTYLTGYTMEYLEDLGLLKMDFLGLKNLTIISDVTKAIYENENIKLDLNNLDLNDKKTLNIFYTVNTEGIFQFESEGMKNFLRNLRITSFDDIVAAIALFRPGPMEMIPTYIKRKQGREKIDYIHPDLESILKSTYGIMIYQEQIMQIANIMADYSLGEADILRRAMSKKKIEILNKEQEKFINNSIKKGYTKEISEKVYNLILKFANYGFNKSHSVAYSMISYQMAYLKAHYPGYFLANLLNNVIGSEIKTKDYMLEVKLNKINILKPDINKSTNKYIVENQNIICPLSIIRNVGVAVTNEILKEKEKKEFTGFMDFVKRTYSKSVNRQVLESLIYAGCFENFEYNKHTLINSIDLAINYAELARDLDESLIDPPEIEILEEFSDDILMKKELEVYGFYLSMHPLSKYKDNNSLNINKLNRYVGKTVNLFAIIESIKEIETKKKDKMAFFKVVDEYNSIDLTLFPKVYENYMELEVNTIVEVIGKVENRNDKLQIIVDKINIL
ncbi:MAG: DNA polymerase III subunit alpha [Bacilli bacterium]|nr:DNA polymerase III subunit alpha [Bacilli bacterium]